MMIMSNIKIVGIGYDSAEYLKEFIYENNFIFSDMTAAE